MGFINSLNKITRKITVTAVITIVVPKERKKTGKILTVMKVLRASAHDQELDCQYKCLQYFNVIFNSDNDRILRENNEIGNRTKQISSTK